MSFMFGKYMKDIELNKSAKDEKKIGKGKDASGSQSRRKEVICNFQLQPSLCLHLSELCCVL